MRKTEREITDFLPECQEVLQKIYERPQKIQSDFCRYRGWEIGVLASLGYITTRMTGGIYGRIWRVTSDGLKYLEELER